ncbi:hypothetical protein BF49_1915 [Bradyrhizobium sp.]|nr:hypothetical protein BF49_1915 [Bradyrhizobium sp.]
MAATSNAVGYDLSFLEIMCSLKCRVSLETIASRYARPSMCLMSAEKVG